MKKKFLIVQLCIVTSGHLLLGLGGFASKTTPSTDTKKTESKPPFTLKDGSPLEKEIIGLSNDIKIIAEELTKALGSKEVTQEIEKKRTAAGNKKPAQAGSKGGYKPGSFRPSSFGGSSGRSSFGSSGGGYKPSYSGSSWGGLGNSGFGGFNRFGRSTPSSSSSSFGSGGSSSPSYKSFGSSEPSSLSSKSSDISSNTSSSSSPRFSSGKTEESSPAKLIRTKLANQYTTYVDKLEKMVGAVTKAENPVVRATALKKMNLGQLNKLFDDIETEMQNLEKDELAKVELEPAWKSAAEKLKLTKNQITPLLVELMIPQKESDLPLIEDARKTFGQLNIAASIALDDLQAIALKRCNIVAQTFKNRVTPTTKANLADELDRIIAQFPADLLGSPIPPVLTETVTSLRR